jgi:hypothetical protein
MDCDGCGKQRVLRLAARLAKSSSERALLAQDGRVEELKIDDSGRTIVD